MELIAPEEKEKFIKELDDAKSKIVFPDNPSLFPESIRIQQQNEKRRLFREKQMDKKRFSKSEGRGPISGDSPQKDAKKAALLKLEAIDEFC